ncbi:MAG: thiamine-binding protein [Acidimicrobiia bacterium]|nr:thiamine-binding protein [Acidimicrobiia bacterium]
MIVEIQVLPSPAGTPGGRWEHVEAALTLIKGSGLSYEVGPMGTSIEGEPDELWPLLRRVHEATLASGAEGVISVVKISESRLDERRTTMAQLVGPWRS